MNLFFPKEYKILLKLGVPITIGQIGMTMQNLADNIMVGHHSTEDLAAAGFVNSMFIMALLLTVGFSIGAISQIGAYYSQGRKDRIVETLKSSIVADGIQGFIVLFFLLVLYFALPLLGQPEELLPLMRPYLLIQILSLPFAFFANPFKQTFDSINDTTVSMLVTLAGNAWNIFFNWVLIFGNLGAPEMGIEGAAWATFSSRVLMLLLYMLVFFFRPKYKEYRSLWKTNSHSREEILLLTSLGWPIGVQMCMEVASFSVVVIFLGWIGTNHLAAHQVMLSVSNVVFMTFMGFSNAVSIRVSNHNGLGDIKGVREASFAGYEIVVLLSVVLSTIVFLFRHQIGYLFTDNAEVASIVAMCTIPLILYQFGDGMQCTFSNALRGLGDVKKLMQYSFIAYVAISIPLSYLFGIVLNMGAFGVWMGFPFGLTTAAILYLRRFLKMT